MDVAAKGRDISHGDMDVVNTPAGLNILITRLSHIGDCILTIPMACALRDQLPGARISWCVEGSAEPLLTGHDAIDELIVLPRGWWKRPSRLVALRGELRQRRFDVTIDPQSLTKSALVARLSGAPRRIGFTQPLARELAPIWNNELRSATQPHLLDRSLELLQALGISDAAIEFRMRLNAQAHLTMQRYRDLAHLGCGFAVINPGGSWPSRRWPSRRFGGIAKYLGQNYQLPSVVTWSGGEEREMASEVAERSGGHALVAPPTSLLELSALLRAAKCYIGGDTGPMHLSAAVGTPCIAMYGPTRAAKSGAYGGQHIHIESSFQDKDKRQGVAAIQSIDSQRVRDACDIMLDRLNVLRVDQRAA